MTRITVKASKAYDVYIGEGASQMLNGLVPELHARRAVLVCGDTVHSLYAKNIRSLLESSGLEVFEFNYPHGEASKNMQTLTELLSFMAESGLDRHDLAVALGGGVTGDLTGFAAAVYMRGIRYIQIPTTLLSMADSSVGGKTAVDLPQGKNLAGAFWQPSFVLCDTAFLGSLPAEIFADGCAEIVKYAVLREPQLLPLLSDPHANIEELLRISISVKAAFVSEDELDKGKRQLLNLGHTVAHAIEKHSGFTVSHGRAVSMGLIAVCTAAEANGDCKAGVSDTVRHALASLGLPVSCDYELSELCKLMLSDKKKAGVDIILAIPVYPGHCELKKIPADKLYSYLLPAFANVHES